jgi:hypothetical protein
VSPNNFGKHSAVIATIPLAGYYENRDGAFYVGTERNTERLPYYARLDIRGDRAYDFNNWRLTLFAQVLNALNRENKRRRPQRIGPELEHTRFYQSMLGLTPTVGILIEF